MSDLKLLTERMVEKKKVEIQSRIDAAELETQKALDKAKKELDEERQQQQQIIDSRLKAKYEQNKNALQIYKRNQLLSEKQVSLTNAFNKAERLMEKWSPAQFQEFLLSVLSQHPENKTMEVVVGENSTAHVSPQWVEEISQTGLKLQLSEEIIPKKAGFVLRSEGIEYNYCFDELIEDVRGQIVTKIANKLFG